MSRSAPRHVGRLLTSIISLVALVVIVPAGLIAASRSRFGSGRPWHGVEPPWTWQPSKVGDALGDRLADDTVIDVIVRVALTTVWAVLLIVLVTTLAEIVHLRRHGGLSVPAVRGLGWAQRIGRFIAAGLIVATPIVTPLTAMATPQASMMRFGDLPSPSTPAVAPVAAERDVRGAPVFPTDPAAADAHPEAIVEPEPDRPIHIVARGESVYSIATDLAGGDASRTEDIAMAIIDLNLGTEVAAGQQFTNPAYIEPGWALVLPDLGTAHGTAQPSPPPADPESVGEPIDTHTVEPGDTLSAIADEHLGDPTAWPEIWNDNADAPMPGGRTFDDPNLILPGWGLDVSGADDATDDDATDDDATDDDATDDEPDDVLADDEPGVDPAAGSATESAAEENEPAAGQQIEDARPETQAHEVISSPAPRPPMTTAAEPVAPASTAPAADRSTASESTTPTTTAAAGTGSGDSSGAARPEQPSAPSPIPLEHAAMLAAGILALVAVRRRIRLRGARPRSRVPDRHPDIVDTERRLRLVDPGERALRADVAMRAAAAHIFEEAQIGLVEVSAEGDVILWLTAPADLPAPWEGGPTRWTLPAGVPVELLGESARRVGAPCIALAQLGTTDAGHDLLIDLEACGTLAIEAGPEQADEILAAIAAGLASSIHAEVAHLIGVGCPREAFLGHRNAHRAADVDAALDLAAGLVGSTLSSERSSFEMRSLHTGGEMWEPAIVLLTSDDDADGAQLRPIPPGQGCAVVAVTGSGGLPSAPTRLRGRPDGWVLEAFGASVRMRPVGLDGHDLHDVAALLEDAAHPLDPEVEAVEAEATETSQGETADRSGHVAAGTDPFVPRDHEIVVHLLDGVGVRSRAGDAGRFERSKTVELIAWLATHRGRMTRSAARTALWELDVRDATFANVVSEARRGLARLVAPPDGTEWLARTLTEDLPLHELVVTDADLIEERMTAARLQPPTAAIDTLRPAVALVEELPFAGTSYLWPDADGITSNVLLLATSAAAELAAHGLAVGDTELVFWATGRGLQVLPGHEELIGLRMRAHAHAGDLAAVRQEWESYERVITADAWSDGEPAPKLVELRHELLSPGR